MLEGRSSISRRQFLRVGMVSAGSLILASCAQPTPAPTIEQPPAEATTVPAEAPETPTEAPESPTEAPPAERVKLEFWHGWEGKDGDAMDAVVQMFMDANPGYEVTPIQGKFDDAIITAISGGAPPDAATTWGTTTIAQWGQSGMVVDLTDMVEAAGGIDESKFYQAAIDVSRHNGRWYSMTVEIDAYGVLYNKAIFEEAGVEPPTTAEEMYQLAIDITEVDAAGNVIRLGMAPDRHAFENAALAYGGHWWDKETGLPTANDAANIAAWNDLSALYESIDPTAAQAFEQQAMGWPIDNAFLGGATAMKHQGDWYVMFARDYAPDLDYDVFPYPPGGVNGVEGTSKVDGAVYAVPTGVKDVEASFNFVWWMGNSEEGSCSLQVAWANASPFKTLANSAECLPAPLYQRYIEIMSYERMSIWPPIAVSAFYWDEYKAAVERVIFGEQTAEEALNGLQATVTSELEKVQA
ncbi:MAG: extracellular solute-binding protein [Chloroflexi bacterium]|nr:extracellular solute-binding protein [Chloroflexota bacterium]